MTSTTSLIQHFEKGIKISFNQSVLEDDLRLWQNRMNLNHWDIRLSEKPGGMKALFQIRIVRERKSAVIYWSSRTKCSYKDMTLGLIHELAHIYLDGMNTEHSFQAHYDIKSDRYEEARARFTNELEQAVETITRTIYNAYIPAPVAQGTEREPSKL